MKADLTYKKNGIFVMFFAETKHGERAFNEMKFQHPGEILAMHAGAVIEQLRGAGYIVAPWKKSACQTSAEDDALLNELTN